MVVYTLGPGFGECQIVLSSTGQVIMLDACTKDGRNLGIELLGALGYTRVDLFVVTHPDTDHVRGAQEVLLSLKPEKVWTYPIHASLRSYLAHAFRRTGSPKPKRLKNVDLVKVAHHGSDGAFHEEAWREHCRNTRDATALIAPFSSSGLPDEAVLQKLRTFATRMAVSTPLSATAAWAQTHGWKPLAATEFVRHADWDLPVIAAVIPTTGAPQLHLSPGAIAWAR